VTGRRRIALAAAALAAATALALLAFTSLFSRTAAVATPPVAAPPPATAARAPEPAAPPAPAPGEDAPSFDPRSWDAVDLEAVRAALPENLYWELGIPTDDARVLRDREDAAARWNDEYGKVLSGTGTEDEIRAYWAHRQRVSSDYAELATWVLDHHEKSLPDRDVALLELARNLHLARLAEIPRRLEEAFARKRAQDAARAAWLADEAAFENDVPTDGDGAKEPDREF
jgi:hypothetical protein